MIFCSELESIHRLFFDCINYIVAKQIWQTISSFFKIVVGSNYLSVAKFWVANKKHAVLDPVCAATLWCLRKTRNDLIFNDNPWMNLNHVWRTIFNSVKRWRLIFKEPV